MLVTATEIKKVRNGTPVSQTLFFAYALLCAQRIGGLLGMPCTITESTKTNTVYVKLPNAIRLVRISDHHKRGSGFHQIIIDRNHPKDDDLAKQLDDVFRRCYVSRGSVPSWDDIKERTSAASRR
jgi:hypothetical protein